MNKVTELPYKAGQVLNCTVNEVPKRQDAEDTIARLMRLDPAHKRALKTAQRMRAQREVMYNRGNRDWFKRERPAKVVRVTPGANWTMPFSFDVARDLDSVKSFLTIK